jgi:Kelch motif
VKDPNRIPRAALVTLVIVLVAAWAGVSSAKPGQSERVAGGPSWRAEATMPVPRSEVAGAVVDGKIAVAGGFLADGRSSRRVDLYDPARDRWSRLPDLPLAVNHAMAAADGRRLYIVGGYGASGPVRAAFVLENRAWRRAQPEAQPSPVGSSTWSAAYSPEGVWRTRRSSSTRSGAGGLLSTGPGSASTSASPRWGEGSTPWAGARPGSIRTSRMPRSTGRRRGSGPLCRRCPSLAAARASRPCAACWSRWAARSRVGRSHPSTRTTGGTGAGDSSPISGRPVTGSPSKVSVAASMPSRVGGSPDCR